MSDLPISFSAPMVRAILREIEQPGTGKTQTRRAIEPYETVPHPFKGRKTAPKNLVQVRLPARLGGFIAGPVFKLRYAVGDRLYVREHWRVSQKWDETAPRDLPPQTMTIFCEAGGSIANQASGRWEPDLDYPPHMPDWAGRFRQAMHMPKWASRITLIVTEVRVERLQDCSETDAVAEGIEQVGTSGGDPMWKHYPDGSPAGGWMLARESYRTLWDSLHGPDAWAANPWVAAYTFRPVLGNIDQIGGAE